jgi:predicted P-loop ATPase/GTPase
MAISIYRQEKEYPMKLTISEEQLLKETIKLSKELQVIYAKIERLKGSSAVTEEIRELLDGALEHTDEASLELDRVEETIYESYDDNSAPIHKA